MDSIIFNRFFRRCVQGARIIYVSAAERRYFTLGVKGPRTTWSCTLGIIGNIFRSVWDVKCSILSDFMCKLLVALKNNPFCLAENSFMLFLYIVTTTLSSIRSEVWVNYWWSLKSDVYEVDNNVGDPRWFWSDVCEVYDDVLLKGSLFYFNVYLLIFFKNFGIETSKYVTVFRKFRNSFCLFVLRFCKLLLWIGTVTNTP